MNRQRVQYYQANSNGFASTYQPPGISTKNYTSARLDDLTNILQDTNQNLKDIDDEINYKHSKEYRRNDRSRSRNNNRECDYNSDSSSMKYYSKSSMSETEDDFSSHGPDRFAKLHGKCRKPSRHNVLFADDMNESLLYNHNNHNNHNHRLVRDFSFHEYDRESRQPLQAPRANETRLNNRDSNYPSQLNNPYMKHRDSELGLENQMETRLKNVYQKMKQHRETNQSKAHMDTIISEMSKDRQDQVNNLNQIIYEAEKSKTQADLLQTKKRLAELEESKHGLAAEVQHLKEQLQKFDSASSQFSVGNKPCGTG